MDPNESPATDRELVLGYRSAAGIESRPHPRTARAQYRVACRSAPRPDLGPWCATEDKAWAAACLRLGLRLRQSIRAVPRG